MIKPKNKKSKINSYFPWGIACEKTCVLKYCWESWSCSNHLQNMFLRRCAALVGSKPYWLLKNLEIWDSRQCCVGLCLQQRPHSHAEEDGDSIFVGASIFKRISPCLVLFVEAAQRRGMRPLSLFWCFNIKKSSKVKSKKYTLNIGYKELCYKK